jgi:hypothetical protein
MRKNNRFSVFELIPHFDPVKDFLKLKEKLNGIDPRVYKTRGVLRQALDLIIVRQAMAFFGY